MCKCGCAVYNCTLITRLPSNKLIEAEKPQKRIVSYTTFKKKLLQWAGSSQTRLTNNHTINRIQLEAKNNMVHAIQLIHKWNAHSEIFMENSKFRVHVRHPQSEIMPAIKCIFHNLKNLLFIVGRTKWIFHRFISFYFSFLVGCCLSRVILSLSLSQNSVREKTVNVSPLLWSLHSVWNALFTYRTRNTKTF